MNEREVRTERQVQQSSARKGECPKRERECAIGNAGGEKEESKSGKEVLSARYYYYETKGKRCASSWQTRSGA